MQPGEMTNQSSTEGLSPSIYLRVLDTEDNRVVVRLNKEEL